MALTVIDTDDLIEAEVRTLLGEPTARRVTAAQIDRWTNEAFTTICRRNMAYEATTQITTINGTVAYAIANCIGVSAAYYTGASATPAVLGSAATRGLLRMHPRHFANIYSATYAVPQEYLWFNGSIYFWPPPNTASNLVEVFYYKVDSSFGGDDFANLPDQYHAYIVWFVYAMALKKLGKMEQAYQYMSYFNNFLDFHKQNELIKPVDSEDMMNHPDTTQFV